MIRFCDQSLSVNLTNQLQFISPDLVLWRGTVLVRGLFAPDATHLQNWQLLHRTTVRILSPMNRTYSTQFDYLWFGSMSIRLVCISLSMFCSMAVRPFCSHLTRRQALFFLVRREVFIHYPFTCFIGVTDELHPFALFVLPRFRLKLKHTHSIHEVHEGLVF